MKKSLLICLSIMMIALVGCKKETNTWGMLEQSSITLEVGQQAQLNFTSNGNKFPRWVSEDDFIASVDSTGLVTANHIGVVTVMVNNLKCKVTVFDNFDVVEPYQLATADAEKIEAYHDLKFGSIAIAEETTEHFCDTVWTKDSEGNDSIKAIVDADYVTAINYDYTGADLFADQYSYKFNVKFDKKKAEYTYSFTSGTMRVAAAHASEVDTYLNNRYEKVSGAAYQYKSGNVYIFVDNAGSNVNVTFSYSSKK